MQELQLDYEIWVVDNGSSDGTLELIQTHQTEDPCVQLISFSANQGTTVSRNRALEKCTGERVLVLDSDAYMNAQALAILLAEFESQPQLGIVTPCLTFPDGRWQLSTDQFPTLGRKFQRVVSLRQMERSAVSQEAGTVDYAISAVWLMRAELLDSVGLLDEKIFYAPEDADYCLRVWNQGYEVRYQPAATVVHDAQERSRGWLPNYFTYLHLKGLAYYFAKHRYCFSAKRLRVRSAIVRLKKKR